MSLEQIFSLGTKLSMIGWLGLVLAPRWSITRDWFAPVIAPLMIGCLYIWLIASNFSLAPDGAEFGSLAGVITLFSVPELVLAGWINYLAFDLFVGAWEVKDAQKEGIHYLVMIPSLLATLMAGPVGLVLFGSSNFHTVPLAYQQQERSDHGKPISA